MLVNTLYNDLISKKSDFFGKCPYSFNSIDISNMEETALKTHKKSNSTMKELY